METTQIATRGWRAGRMFGAPVVVSPSTLVIIGVLAYLWASAGGAEVTSSGLIRGATFAVMLFASVLVHEIAHAVTARAFGRRIDEIALTLVGGHTRFDGTNMTPTVAGVTGAAGPIANVVLGAVAFGALRIGVPDGALVYVSFLAGANMLLAGFNALPGLPMDGGHVTEAIVWGATKSRARGTIVAAWLGRVLAIAIPVAVVANSVRVAGKPGIFDVMWAIFVFGLLWWPASSELKRARTSVKVEAITAGHLMRPAVGVPYTATVAHAVAAAEAAGVMFALVIGADGSVAGYFPLTTAARVPLERRGATSLESVSQELPHGAEIDMSVAGDAIIDHIRRWWGATEMLAVVDDGEPVGVMRLVEAVDHLRGKRKAAPPA